jgi:hypothetical protein
MNREHHLLSTRPPRSDAQIRAVLCAAALLLNLATVAASQDTEAADATSMLVRIETSEPRQLGSSLSDQGFDVLPPSPGEPGLRLIVSGPELADLDARGLQPELLDHGRPFQDIQVELAADGGTPSGYMNLAQIEAAMADLAAAHPTRCQLVNLTSAYALPTTAEGRSLYALKISDNVTLEEDEPTVLLVSAHHCRELVTPVIALNAAQTLLELYDTDPDVTAAVDGHEIWIAPVWNPDGYNHVFTVDNFWRKNRRVLSSDIGVDLNRNYPFGWSSACSGSTSESSQTYKGPVPASESETQTMMALATDRNFAKVIDFHSYGQEVLWSFDCTDHVFDTWLQAEAAALSTASGYAGAERPPTADGEHYQWELGVLGSHSFLIETDTTFQPLFAQAESEASLVWGGILFSLQRPLPLSGHVTDACTNLPVAASIEVISTPFPNGETNAANATFGSYRAFMPNGAHTIRFSAPDYASTDVLVSVTDAGAVVDVALTPLAPNGCWTDLGQGKAGVSGVPGLLGVGSLAAGAAGELRLDNAAPSSPAHLVVGLALLGAPFKDGVMVPQPDLILQLVSDTAGQLELPFVLPGALPPGLTLWFQCWVEDNAASLGLSASNALSAATG